MNVSIKRIIIGTVIGSAILVAVVVSTYDKLLTEGGEAVYNYENVFQGGALLWRPPGTEALKLFDLSDATITVVQMPWPISCAKLIINSRDGNIEAPCVRNALPSNVEEAD